MTSPVRTRLSDNIRAASSSLGELSRRSVLLAGLVEAASRRRDVRELRAQIVLLLLKLRCPLGARPGKSWYVPGAVARLGAEGLLRAWEGFFGEEPPCLRSMRSHLGALEQSGILRRSPGDWMVWRDPAHPERRPRWPDTLHVLDGEDASEFWAGPGQKLLDLYPAAKSSPDVWRRLFGNWRTAGAQLVLDFEAQGAVAAPRARANAEEVPEQRERGIKLARALKRSHEPLAVLTALSECGVDLRGGAGFRAAGAPRRLRGAAAVLARALMRGDRIRNLSGWLWRVFEDGEPAELAAACAWIGDDLRSGDSRR